MLCLTGDNLGSHFIGGFVTNFSNAKYACRYCMKPRENWFDSANECCLRTIKGYDRSVSESISSAVSSHCGVKFSSRMNLLDYFHVCAPGLPPCLAHDLFEGIVPQDVMIYLKHFVQLGWFTID